MNDFSREMERRLQTFGKDIQNFVRKLTDDGDSEGFMPLVDIAEDDKHCYVLADLPGMNKEDIGVTVDEGVITIKGKRDAASEGNVKVTRRERGSGTFNRSITLPEYTNTKDVKASFRKGVLEIKILKTQNGNSENSIKIE